jgi:hypothetical protein
LLPPTLPRDIFGRRWFGDSASNQLILLVGAQGLEPLDPLIKSQTELCAQVTAATPISYTPAIRSQFYAKLTQAQIERSVCILSH